jgi:hypothetical protein
MYSLLNGISNVRVQPPAEPVGCNTVLGGNYDFSRRYPLDSHAACIPGLRLRYISTNCLAGLEFILREGFPQDKLVALRQCIKKIIVNKPAGELKLSIYFVPTGNLQATQECKISV